MAAYRSSHCYLGAINNVAMAITLYNDKLLFNTSDSVSKAEHGENTYEMCNESPLALKSAQCA